MQPDPGLQDAISEQALVRRRFKPQEDRAEFPCDGEIRLVRGLSSETQRLAVVLRVCTELNYAEICLLSNEIDMMSRFDFVLARSETGLPFDVIAQLDLTAPTYLIQTSCLFGRINSDSLVKELLAASTGNVEHLSQGLRGLPIRGPADPRWGFKEAELSDLNELSHECARDLAESKTYVRTVVDPALLDEVISQPDLESLETVQDLLAIAEAAQGAVASATQISSLLDQLQDLFAMDPTLQLAMQPLLEAAISSPPPTVADTPLEFTFDREQISDEHDQEFSQLLVGLLAQGCGTLLRMVTTETAWEKDLQTSTPWAIQIPGHDPAYIDARDPRRQP
ncbi:MAG: hypothetical protein GY906_34230 [bacterium]|nr:hypothetical protein [bacterium]